MRVLISTPRLILLTVLSLLLIRPENGLANPSGPLDLERGYLYETLELSFEPIGAWIIFQSADAEFRRVSAKVVAVVLPHDGSNARWLVGTRVPSDVRGAILNFYAIALGAHGEIDGAFSSSRELNESEASIGLSLNERTQVLENWRRQLAQQEASLKRLRSDVDVIADIGRIVEVREESKQILKRIEDIGRDLDELAATVGTMKNKPAPNNFLRREAELTQQLAELAATAKRAESTAQSAARKGKQKSDQQLIEAAKGIDLADLESKLKELEKQRQKLEAA